ncbi:MAG TPA: response regulator [Acidimicrobiales bacterium]|nr:response regulator [Acidimicrobiales bacterium]
MRKVIVASDAPFLRAEVAAVIGDPDTDIIEIRSGAEVREAVAEHNPDLVVVDLQMDSMGAMAVCLDLRLEESYGNLPPVAVLMLLDRRADVFLAKRSGAEGWLVKPLDPIRLRRATAALLAGETYHDESFMPVPVLSGRPAAGT